MDWTEPDELTETDDTEDTEDYSDSSACSRHHGHIHRQHRKKVYEFSEDELNVDDHEPLIYRDVKIRTDQSVDSMYVLLDVLGKGKFGIVYRCMEKTTANYFAAKAINVHRISERKQVQEEVELMNDLHHPRLLQLIDAFDDGKRITIVTELALGGELFSRVIDEEFVLTEKVCSIFMRQICEGVEYMHSHNVVHLDLKPENVLCVTPTGNRIKLIDFGLARRCHAKDNIRVLFGTPEFVAPEVINYDRVSLATDMWSVGVICYILLSGLSPFMGDNDVETLSNVTNAAWDFDDECFDAISEEARDFITQLLIKRPEKRATATALLKHRWLKQSRRRSSILDPAEHSLSKSKLRHFVIRRRWQKVFNTIRALRRMGSFFRDPNTDTETGDSPDLEAVHPAELVRAARRFSETLIVSPQASEAENAEISDAENSFSEQPLGNLSEEDPSTSSETVSGPVSESGNQEISLPKFAQKSVAENDAQFDPEVSERDCPIKDVSAPDNMRDKINRSASPEGNSTETESTKKPSENRAFTSDIAVAENTPLLNEPRSSSLAEPENGANSHKPDLDRSSPATTRETPQKSLSNNSRSSTPTKSTFNVLIQRADSHAEKSSQTRASISPPKPKFDQPIHRQSLSKSPSPSRTSVSNSNSSTQSMSSQSVNIEKSSNFGATLTTTTTETVNMNKTITRRKSSTKGPISMSGRSSVSPCEGRPGQEDTNSFSQSRKSSSAFVQTGGEVIIPIKVVEKEGEIIVPITVIEDDTEKSRKIAKGKERFTRPKSMTDSGAEDLLGPSTASTPDILDDNATGNFALDEGVIGDHARREISSPVTSAPEMTRSRRESATNERIIPIQIL